MRCVAAASEDVVRNARVFGHDDAKGLRHLVASHNRLVIAHDNVDDARRRAPARLVVLLAFLPMGAIHL